MTKKQKKQLARIKHLKRNCPALHKYITHLYAKRTKYDHTI